MLRLPRSRRFAWGILIACLGEPAAAQPVERPVATPTRLDWAFAVQGFGKGADGLPAGYDSTKQRYQLYVPKQTKRGQAAPLILFISAGGEPMGWNAWKAICEQQGAFFCSPFAAGNSVAPGQRARVILDALDDVRRNHRIDPEQTYLTGFSGGARMACALAFALPEYFGGVVPLCGTNPPAGPTYLRHRLQDRLSVALVTGVKDFNRKETEDYMAPWLKELGIRTRLWVVPKMGHEIPGADVLRETYAWLKEDLPRRRADAKAHPELAVAPDEAPAGAALAKRLTAAAQTELKQPEHAWRGITLLQGAALRGTGTEPGKQARQRLKEVLEDEALLTRVAEQGAKDEQRALSAQARALERFGLTSKAIEAWQLLAKNYAGTAVGRQAEEEVRRLETGKRPAKQ